LASVSRLTEPHETALIRRVTQFPEVIENAARDLEPHQLAHYLRELAGDFHSYYNAHRFAVEDAALRNARITLALAAQQVIRNGLALLGVSAPEAMEREIESA
jgi:arginyl-tRNA synthetase